MVTGQIEETIPVQDPLATQLRAEVMEELSFALEDGSSPSSQKMF